jgi:transmembrane sensor
MPVQPHQPIPPAILEAASLWLARRDRGLTPAEQDSYMQWLAADPRHTEALAQHAAALERMMQLYEWTPAHDTEPNPELFAPAPDRQRGKGSWTWTLRAAAAIAVMLTAFALFRSSPENSQLAKAPESYLRVNDTVALPDGSRAQVKDGSRIVVQYSATERRVQLAGGEAHFSVWKDPARPFIVSVGKVEVRAVGTAFNVRVNTAAVEVLVTEGKVSVADVAQPQRMEALVTVGERAVVPMGDPAGATPGTAPAAPVVTPVTMEDIASELAWQKPRLEFFETPLAEAIAEFNRLNRHQLALADPALGAERIGGTFRPDNVEAFVRLLEETNQITGVPDGENRTVLRKLPPELAR